jgi:hypothetical protein
MKTLLTISLLLVFFTVWVHAQIFTGPASGSVSGGVVVSTGTMTNMTGRILPGTPIPPRNKIPIPLVPRELSLRETEGPVEGSNFVFDPAVTGTALGTEPPLLLNSFPGIPQTNSIPPDPYCAAGPEHVMVVVNSTFRIYDKYGNIEYTILADPWFSSVLPSPGAFDPKVTYDHFAQRWIMVWLQQDDASLTSHFLLSVSDDSNPNGTWYNWALPANVNGSASVSNWADYQGVGYDSLAIYLTSNQFAFGGSFQYAKIRVIAKAQLYNNTAGPVTWMDLWDIRDPLSTGTRVFTIRPSRTYTQTDTFCLINRSPFSDPQSYVNLFKLTNPLTTPGLTGNHVTVTAYRTPPLADQLGGSTIGIESGGSHFRNEPVFKNGYLWATHAVASGSSFQYGSVNYLKIDVHASTSGEDYTIGADTYWYFYPALALDDDNNLLLTYSRSGTTEYIGAFFTGVRASDPPGTFTGSHILKEGEANYVKDFGSGRNRWGDYMGAWTDPRDPHNIWIYTEYAESPANTWGVYVGRVLVTPFSVPRVYTSTDTLEFLPQEVGTTSGEGQVTLRNLGQDTLLISNLSVNGTRYQITSSHTFPIGLGYLDSVDVTVNYAPTSATLDIEDLVIQSNDGVQGTVNLPLKGRGYVIDPTVSGEMYAAGTGGNGSLYGLSTGQAVVIGETQYTEIKSLTVRHSNNELYGFVISGSTSIIVRVNTTLGDAYPKTTLPFNTLKAIEFDQNDSLYGILTNGKLIRINPENGDTVGVSSTGVTSINGLAAHPATNDLWIMKSDGRLYQAYRFEAPGRLVLTPGLSSARDLAFGANGTLFALVNTGADLYVIDTTAGASVLWSTGVSGLNGLALRGNLVGIQEPQAGLIPSKFALHQSYPNPFNPSTTIRYEVPADSRVQIKVYNTIGQMVATLVDKRMKAGAYEVQWNGRNASGVLVSSGVYLYTMEAAGFRKSRKMILLK